MGHVILLRALLIYIISDLQFPYESWHYWNYSREMESEAANKRFNLKFQIDCGRYQCVKDLPRTVHVNSIGSLSPGGEDFRKALQTANSCIKELEELSLSEAVLPKSSIIKIPDVQSTTNDKGVELMGNLINVLRRHLRVKYQLDFSEILHA